MIGQDRALAAVQFGVGIQRDGFNLFVMGQSGSGKYSLVQEFINEKAAHQNAPDDWCYVNNFNQAHKPRALQLPAGQGAVLQKALSQLIDELHSAIPAAFESDDYRSRLESIEDEFKTRQENALQSVQQSAEEYKIKLLRTPDGFAFAPLLNGEIIEPDDFKHLPQAEQDRFEHIISELQARLHQLFEQIPKWAKETRDKVRELNREVTALAVGHLIEDLKQGFQTLPAVLAYLEELRQDIIVNAILFRKREEGGQTLASLAESQHNSLNRYRINLLVDHSTCRGAPVFYEDQPNFQNLVGRVEHISQMGTLITDFTLIKPGALHRANGGYLILEAQKVLTQPFVWDALKRVLRSGFINIDSIGQMLSLISTVSLEPEPIPVNVKVVLLGERMLYYLLSELDPEFSELFKVVADFEDDIDRNEENDLLFAHFLATMARRQKLHPLSRTAVCRVIEQAARLSDDAEKLSTHLHSISDLLCEADYWATQLGHTLIEREDIQKAIDERFRRHSRIYERMQEEILRDTLRIDTEGSRVATINGLTVSQLGDFSFGHPMRLTATARMGEGHIIDIEREVELGGPIHSKGVLILSSFLGNRYAHDAPLSLHASLVFEQSYGDIEGDSASLAELCVLLSALAEAPIEQSLAITGSVNQHGEVQAIGGVNEKIEGFFDICNKRGLHGKHGVIIPADNVKHLMLRQDVREAAARGLFHVFAIRHVDEAVELLTGLPAGMRNLDGQFSEESINGRVENKLTNMSVIRHTYSDMLKHLQEEEEAAEDQSDKS